MTDEQKAVYMRGQVALMEAERVMREMKDRHHILKYEEPYYSQDSWKFWLNGWEKVISHNPMIDLFHGP